jgi:hypothetical protein
MAGLMPTLRLAITATGSALGQQGVDIGGRALADVSRVGIKEGRGRPSPLGAQHARE